MPVLAKRNPLVLGYSPYEHPGSIFPFNEVFQGGSQNVKEKGFDGIDALILWGGTDVPPQWYGQKPHRFSGAPAVPSPRDEFEKKAVLLCKTKGIPIIGICRGSQFLCVMSGGSLIQHVDGHGYPHRINTITGDQIAVTSTHHQMMFPYAIPHTLIGWTTDSKTSRYEGENDVPNNEMFGKKEPEIVYFPQVNGLAIQGHPEYSTATPAFIKFCNNAVKDYLFPPF